MKTVAESTSHSISFYWSIADEQAEGPALYAIRRPFDAR
jgi:hypothetical protein